jgi:ATP-dependent DNA ligase
VVPDADDRSNFAELHRRGLLQRPRMIDEAAARTPAVLIVSDLLELDGNDLRQPLFERRVLLHERDPGYRTSPMDGDALFAAIVGEDHKGIVAKRLDAPHRMDRQPSWLKIKRRATPLDYAPGGRYATTCARPRASSVSSTVSSGVVSNFDSAPPPPIAIAIAAIDTLSGASQRL